MRAIYEIDADILALQNEDGEITDYDALDALVMERDAKIENVVCWIKDMVAEAAAIREEEKRLAARRKVLENKIEGLQRWLGRVLNGQKFSTARCAVSWRKSESTVWDASDEERIYNWLKRNRHKECYTVKTTLSRSGIGELLRRGLNVPGARLEEKQNISVK